MYVIRQHDAGAQLTIEGEDADENRAIFEELAEQRPSIEDEFGGKLEWSQVEGRKRRQIGVTIPGGGYRDDRGRWPEIQDAMIDAMVRLERALKPRIKDLRL